MKKILFVITGFTKGGAERQLLNILTGINNKYEIQVVGFFDGYFRKEIEKLGIKVNLISVKSNFGFFKSVLKLNNLVKEFNPDIIQSMLPHSNIVSKIVNAINFNKYIIYTGVRNSKDTLFLGFLEKITDYFSTNIITNSDTNKKELIKRGFKENKIIVIYNGINFQKPKERYSYDKKVILTVAKFFDQKDYETNILVAEKLSKLRTDFEFHYVGNGPDFDKIKSIIKSKKLEGVIKTLGVRNDIPELMNSSDLFFLPTKFEGQANVILESMYYNLPIITTNIPENIEITEALFSNIGDVDSFVKNINDFLDGNIYFIDKIDNNKKNIENFKISIMVDNYLKLYK